MMSEQDRIDVKGDVNQRKGMVLIRLSGKAFSGIFWRQEKIWLRIKMPDIEGRGDYRRS